MINKILKYIINGIPKSDYVNKLANYYVDHFNNDNNMDFNTNGEARLLDSALRLSCMNPVIFDVGANIGDWSRRSLCIAPQAELHLFEPSAVTYNALDAQDWPSHVRINNFGLGEKNEALTLNIFGEKSGLNSLYARRGIGDNHVVGTEKIKIRTLDGYCEEFGIKKIDFMKVDVEGHELSVFKGACSMLRAGNISIIQFEYGGCSLDSRVHLADIWDFLSNYGYRLAKVYPNRLQYYHEYNQKLESFKYSNWVATYDNE